jgi:hypothetical protein
VDQGILPEHALNRGLAGSYWIQGADEFLAGRYLDAVRSGLRAIQLHPASLMEKVPRLIWLFRERWNRSE